ncbi:MAG TPA: hypothetical protein VKE41_23910 [Roseiflexaceae bacterium]|nr:hypothetical protein [Roseiflexaceae bacterium]
MSFNAVTLLTTDLRHHIASLGQHGGAICPSIYDTAQVLRFCPPREGIQSALDWLRTQQYDDGGWGSPAIPRARTMPTLAAVLALHTHGITSADRNSVNKGLVFLRSDVAQWLTPLPEELPAGVELLLPRLLADASRAGLDVPHELTATITDLARHRRKGLAQMRPRGGTTAVHSWEAWGTEPDPALLDGAGSIGHSPAATAAWLAAAAARPDLEDARAACRAYLADAAAATGLGIPGVVPTAWPIQRFEQSFGLYILLLAGLLDHPSLQDVVRPQIDALTRALRPEGIGFSDWFAPDGDDTAAALAVLQASGRRVDLAVLNHFVHDDHFTSWQGELQAGVSVTAHALHALALSKAPVERYLPHLLAHQQPDGRWLGDKWNASWLYTTWQATVVLLGTKHAALARQAAAALLAHQYPDGSWGMADGTREETAYGVLALRAVQRGGIRSEAISDALRRAERWMRTHYRPLAVDTTALWLAKESYRALRLSRIIELAATLPAPDEHDIVIYERVQYAAA